MSFKMNEPISCDLPSIQTLFSIIMMSSGKQHFTTYCITIGSDINLIFLEVINNGKVKAPANLFMSSASVCSLLTSKNFYWVLYDGNAKFFSQGYSCIFV